MTRTRVALAAIVFGASQAVAQFSLYGSPNDPSGNPLPVPTWSGPPAIGNPVLISYPMGVISPLGYSVLCNQNSGQSVGHLLIVGSTTASTIVTPGMAPFMCLPQWLLLDLTAPYVLFGMGPIIVPTPWNPIEPIGYAGWWVNLDIPNDPSLVGLTFYAQATALQVGPGGCAQCVFQMTQGLQAVIQ